MCLRSYIFYIHENFLLYTFQFEILVDQHLIKFLGA